MKSHRMYRRAIAIGSLVLAAATSPASAQDAPLMRAEVTALVTTDRDFLDSGEASPDGRWIVYAQAPSTNTSHLWVRAAGGGSPIQLTSGPYFDKDPMFGPDGDRIYFTSNRASRNGPENSHFMTMPFDPATGRAGPPRQVSLDARDARVRILRPLSPDGRWLVYVCCGDGAIRLVPSAGGESRVVARPNGRTIHIVWSADAQSVLVTYVDTIAQVRHRMRAFVDGRTAETIGSVPVGNGFGGLPLPDGRFAFPPLNPSVRGPAVVYGVINDSSRALPVARFELPGDFSLTGISADGRTLIGNTSNDAATIIVRPIAGGAPQRISTGDVYDWVAGWSEGEPVYYADRPRDGVAPYVATPSVRRALQSTGDATPAVHTTTGGWATYTLPGENGVRTLHAIEIASGRTVTLSTAYVAPISGAGGWYGVDGRDFVFVERRGDGRAVIAMRPGGERRVIREFAGNADIELVAASHVLWTERAAGGRTLLIADGPAGAPKRLYTVPDVMNDIAISYDGTRLAVGTADAIHVLRLNPDLSIAGEPQIVPVPFEYWYETQWLADNSGFTTLAQIRGEQEPDVVLIRLADPSRPINLTRDDPNAVWGYSLSPDGTRIAYPSEIRRGSTLWRVDIGPILDAVRRRP